MPSTAALSVFVSSTSIDLVDYRAKVRDIILSLGFRPIMMEYFPAMDAAAVDACMKAVDEANIYIGIYAHRYGFCPVGSAISITEMEFNRATARGIPRLCFLVDENTPWPPQHIESEPGRTSLRAFKARLNASLVRKTFTTPENLATSVSLALQDYAVTSGKSKTAVTKHSAPPPVPGIPASIPSSGGSPFIVGRPLRANEKIFGREEAFHFVQSELSKFSSINIYGERRMGKTSLYNHLVGNQRDLFPRKPDEPPLILAAIDLQKNVTNASRFYGLAVRELLSHLPPVRDQATKDMVTKLKPQLDAKPETDYDTFERTLRQLRDTHGLLVRSVLLIDEFERLLEPSDPQCFPYPEFFNGLRALITEGLLAMIIFSRRRLVEYFHDPSRPGTLTSTFPSYPLPFELHQLNEAAADALLLQPSDHQLTLSEAAQAKQLSKRHPCLLQAAGEARYQAKANHYDNRWMKQRFEAFKAQNCTPLKHDTSGESSDGIRHKLWQVAKLILWRFPMSIGRVAMRVGLKLDDIAAWFIGVALIVMIILLLFGVANGADINGLIKRGLNLP